MPDHDIGCILTCWRRPQLLARQLEAVRNQSVPPTDIIVWVNDPGDPRWKVPWDVLKTVPFVYSSKNAGVWPRFAVAMHLKNRHCAIFDDDTIPGSRWFENCLNHVTHANVCGAVGVSFLDGTRQSAYAVGGWRCPNPKPVTVDLLGHAWFFKHYARLLECFSPYYKFNLRDTAGEDYALAYAAQKAKMRSIVPPHPEDDRSLWGSIEGELGTDEVALYRDPKQESEKENAHNGLKRFGWKTISDRKKR